MVHHFLAPMVAFDQSVTAVDQGMMVAVDQGVVRQFFCSDGGCPSRFRRGSASLAPMVAVDQGVTVVVSQSDWFTTSLAPLDRQCPSSRARFTTSLALAVAVDEGATVAIDQYVVHHVHHFSGSDGGCQSRSDGGRRLRRGSPLFSVPTVAVDQGLGVVHHFSCSDGGRRSRCDGCHPSECGSAIFLLR